MPFILIYRSVHVQYAKHIIFNETVPKSRIQKHIPLDISIFGMPILVGKYFIRSKLLNILYQIKAKQIDGCECTKMYIYCFTV